MPQAIRVRAPAAAGWDRGFLAGVGAGVVAAAATVAVSLIGGRVPPPISAGWSALVAGVAGGLLYVWLTRVSARPAAAFWIITLVLATIDTLFIALLRLPSGGATVLGVPIFGLVVPIKQLLALVGLGHFSAQHFPARFLPTDAAMHYVTAVVVSLLVPRWVGPKR
jgi:hypothetical protein